MICFEPIGEVHNKFDESVEPSQFEGTTSELQIQEAYHDGLKGHKEGDYIVVVFVFHKSKGFDLVSPRRKGKVKGVFASRSPHRPNNIGITTVKLLSKKEGTLKVLGLDALNGSPILDLKPYASCMDDPSPLKYD